MDETLHSTLVSASLVVAALVWLLYRYATATFDTFEKQGLKAPKPVPLFGNMLELFKKSPAYIDTENAQLYGKVYGTFSGRRPVLMVGDADMVREITTKSFHCFGEHTRFRSMWQKPLDRTLSILTGEHWRHVRGSISPTFTSGRLKQMLPLIRRCAHSVLAYLEKTGSSTPINASHLMSGYTLDVIAATAFGLDIHSLEEPLSPFQKHAAQLFSRKAGLKRVLAVVVTYISWWLTLLASKVGITVFDPVSLEYMEMVVRHTVTEANAKPGEEKNFAQLCRSQLVDIKDVSKDSCRVDDNGHIWTTKGLLLEEIVANSVVFIVAGYDTTSTLLSCFCYAMAVNPEVQEKLFRDLERVQETAGGDSDEQQQQQEAAAQDSPYLDWCISETLRMYPPSLRVDRRCTQSLTVAGIAIPKDMTVNIPVYALHHDPDYWPEPFEFKPERFSPAESASRNQGCYLPFGLGPRNCLGMRFALLVAKSVIIPLLMQYRIAACDDTPEPPLKLGRGISFLTPEQPLLVRFVPR